MRVLLCGYHEAGYRALRTLVERRHEVLVATHATPPELPNVAALARSYSIDAIVDDDDTLLAAAQRFKPDVILSVYYRRIIREPLLTLASRGALNFHPSLLPRHRGCFSAPWAIIEGDRETGVTCHDMTPEIDAGDAVDVSFVSIEESETGMSLYYKLVDATANLFSTVLDAVEGGCIRRTPQSGIASYHPRQVPFGGLIDPSWSRACIERFIRAMYFPPFPSAAVMVDGVRRSVRSLEEYDRVTGGGKGEEMRELPRSKRATVESTTIGAQSH